MDSLACNKRKK